MEKDGEGGGEKEGVRKNYKLKKEAGIDHSLVLESLSKEREKDREKERKE